MSPTPTFHTQQVAQPLFGVAACCMAGDKIGKKEMYTKMDNNKYKNNWKGFYILKYCQTSEFCRSRNKNKAEKFHRSEINTFVFKMCKCTI